jgi:hypothetical protein
MNLRMLNRMLTINWVPGVMLFGTVVSAAAGNVPLGHIHVNRYATWGMSVAWMPGAAGLSTAHTCALT